MQRSQVTPYGVNSRLSSIKSKLEDWFFSEYNREVTNKYGLFYYGDIAKNDSFVLKARETANKPRNLVLEPAFAFAV